MGIEHFSTETYVWPSETDESRRELTSAAKIKRLRIEMDVQHRFIDVEKELSQCRRRLARLQNTPIDALLQFEREQHATLLQRTRTLETQLSLTRDRAHTIIEYLYSLRTEREVYYKVVAVDKNRYYSVYDGRQYELGREYDDEEGGDLDCYGGMVASGLSKRKVSDGFHGAGYFVNMTLDDALGVRFPLNSKLLSLPRVILACRTGGEMKIYVGHKVAFQRLRPVCVVASVSAVGAQLKAKGVDLEREVEFMAEEAEGTKGTGRIVQLQPQVVFSHAER